MKQRCLFFIFLIPLFFSCKKEQNQIPSVAVYLELNLNLPEYIDLAVPGGWAYLSGGSNGIVIYRISFDEFIALDRHSTHNVNDYCQVEIDESNIILIDPCSASSFSLIDGQIITGPATFPLKKYNTTFNSPILTVF